MIEISHARQATFISPFLYHAATRILRCQVMREETLGPERKAGAVARLVCGLDIHPVAVEIARATLLRALPAPPPDHDGAIRVHQGDSLMAQPEADNMLFTHTKDTLRFETPQGGEIHLPRSFTRHRQFSEPSQVGGSGEGQATHP